MSAKKQKVKNLISNLDLDRLSPILISKKLPDIPIENIYSIVFQLANEDLIKIEYEIACPECSADVKTVTSLNEIPNSIQCDVCNYTFEPDESDIWIFIIPKEKLNINQSQSKKVERVCEFCGKTFKIAPSSLRQSGGRFCTRTCKDTFSKGKNASAWKGGISFKPYCPKFNDEFKERVREFWDRKCGICGKTENENIKEHKQKLSVHHVNYEKMVCCNNVPPLFIPSCKRCYGKTNENRTGWEHNLTEYIMTYFNGESYLPKS